MYNRHLTAFVVAMMSVFPARLPLVRTFDKEKIYP